MKLGKTTDDTTKKTTKRDEANRDANKQKPKSNIENRKNGKRRQKTKSFREQKKNEIPKISTDEAKEHLRGSGKANSNAELQAAQSNVDTIIVKMARPRRGNVAAAFFI